MFYSTTKKILLGILCLAILSPLMSQNCLQNATISFKVPACHRDANGAAQVNLNGSLGTDVGYQYEWSNGKYGPIQKYLEAGNYSVSITEYATNCQKVISFMLPNPPIYSAQALATPTSDCINSGTVTVEAFATEGNTTKQVDEFDVKWDDGESGKYRQGLAAGLYGFYIIVDGCYAYSIATVNTTPSMQVSITTNDAIIDQPGEEIFLSSTVSGGTPNYFYTWKETISNQVIANQPHVGLGEPGDYVLEVIDGDGCLAISNQITVDQKSNLPPPTTFTDQVYPNPSSEMVHVPIPQGKQTIRLIDLNGKSLKIKQSNIPAASQLTIPVNDLAKGLYMIKIEDDLTKETMSHKIQIN